MSYDEYLAIAGEIDQLQELLSEIPPDSVLERMGLEARLASAQQIIAGIVSEQLVHKARLTFRGRPVVGSHGIAADFAGKAAGAFSDAVAAVAAGIGESLRYMGPIPDKSKNQLLITGTAVGSFGFEFELPKPQDHDLFPEPSKAEDALEKIQALMRQAAQGTDDEVAELVEEIHPRAVRKVADFLGYLLQQDAWCGLEFKNQYFRFQDMAQLKLSATRLQEDNIHETVEEYLGEFQGVLPASRTFEFKLRDQAGVLKGKVDTAIEDPDLLNREWLHKPARIKLNVIQVGQGRPRFTLLSLDALQPLASGG
ncbi:MULTISPECIES: hypothetical protein [Pseudomonadaceae]|uniref:Uncharacterized protein n=1 Tax=Ectopseudomonas toyotomiensis TaxID=554344 RepID=A0AA42LM21_9GAMM|nr:MULTISPECIES: hypothetical protein [Pseudomonas]AQZ32060.1 hypothetical protein BHQ29_01350 [Pseudomonas sp. LPH1]MBG0841657.1 hypothetical protein [Pseudomonas toyotomiensis]MDH0702825.1 hypothetical protein [Pseudomonas toyotomiensis]